MRRFSYSCCLRPWFTVSSPYGQYNILLKLIEHEQVDSYKIATLKGSVTTKCGLMKNSLLSTTQMSANKLPTSMWVGNVRCG